MVSSSHKPRRSILLIVVRCSAIPASADADGRPAGDEPGIAGGPAARARDRAAVGSAHRSGGDCQRSTLVATATVRLAIRQEEGARHDVFLIPWIDIVVNGA